MRIAAPSDKHFRRAHVIPARRRPSRRSRPVMAGAAVVCALAMYALHRAVDLVLTSEAMTVSQIAVSGNTRMSRGEVLALLAGARGVSMMTVDLEAWRQELLDSPWVAAAAIRRVLPGTLEVAISERQPIGIARIDGRLYLVDRDGTIIDEFGPSYAEFDLPIIDGLAAPPGSGGALIDESRAALAGRLLTDLQRRPALARLVSQIDVTDGRGASVILDGDTTRVKIGDDRFAERVQSYLELRQALRDRIPEIDYVDLRFDERVYVGPRGRTGGS